MPFERARVGRLGLGRPARLKLGLVLSCAVLLPLSLAACVGDTGAGYGSSSSGLTIAIGSPVSTLDPTQNSYRDQIGIEGLWGGTLTKVNDDGTKAAPGLAESWTPGPEKWTFKLRRNIKFSDGTPLTAGDVAASLNFLREKDDHVGGYLLTPISSARATGKRTVEVNLSQPTPRLDLALGTFAAFIFPADRLDDDAESVSEFLASEPVSAGQYMVTHHSASNLVLEANPNYRGATPAVSRLQFVSVPDAASRLAQLQGEQVDVADNLPVQTAEQLTGDVHGQWYNSAIGGNFLVMNTRDSAPTSDPKLRAAISAAIDRRQLSDIVHLGENPPQLGFFPKGSPLHREVVSPDSDVEKAKELLAQSDCEAPCELTIRAKSSYPNDVQMAQLITQQLDAIDVDASVVQQDPEVLGEDLDNGNFDLGISGAYGAHIDDYLNYTLPSDGGARASEAAWEGADPFVKTWQTTSGDAFDAAVNTALDHYQADQPFIPLVGFGFLNGSTVPDDVFGVTGTLTYRVGAEHE